MDNKRAVRKSTAYIATWTLILSALTQSVFLVIGKWDLTVLFGNLLSAGLSILNFWLMCVSIVKAAAMEDDKDRRQRAKVSRIYRFLMMIVVLGVGLLLPKVFSPWTVVIPIFFPRIAMLFLPLFKNKLD